MRVLACDDERVQQKIIEKFLGDLDIDFRIVGSGEEAISALQAEDFDLVLMDRLLPGMDGLEATRRVKQLLLSQKKWIPVVLLTSLGSERDVIDGLEAGADDYLVKPIKFELLRARLNVFIRLSKQAKLLRERSEALHRYRELAEREKVFGTHVLASMTRRAELRDPDLFVWQRPADQISGDVVAFRRTATSRYLLLADAMGHGLSAAFATILAVDLFYAMTAKDLPIADISIELNRKLSGLVPSGYLVSGVLVQATGNEVRIINAGMPGVLMLSAGQCVRHFKSINLPFAVQRDEWRPAGESAVFRRGDRLVVLSDGLTEASASLADRMASQDDIGASLNAEFPSDRKFLDDATAAILTL